MKYTFHENKNDKTLNLNHIEKDNVVDSEKSI